MSGYDYLPELARDLNRLVPVDHSLVADWTDVVRRVGPERRLGRSVGRQALGSPLRIAFAVVVAFLLLAGIAAAAYVLATGSGGGAVALVHDTGNGADSVSTIEPNGQVRTVWHCPGDRFCGNVVSVAWAPDGRRLALTLSELGGQSLYVGLHIVDTATGRDIEIPPAPTRPPRNGTERLNALRALEMRHLQVFGCLTPRELAWSPDGRRLAYACGDRPHSNGDTISVINADGSHRITLRTGIKSAGWPSWSPDGTQIVFSTETVTGQLFAIPGPSDVRRSSVYVVAVHGQRRKLIASAGTAPAWSPDGKTIAYRGRCGYIRLVTPTGKDVTPGPRSGLCPGIRPAGWPAWSPDGTRLAIATTHGVYAVDPDGSRRTRISNGTFFRLFGDIRPAWQPLPRQDAKRASTP